MKEIQLGQDKDSRSIVEPPSALRLGPQRRRADHRLSGVRRESAVVARLSAPVERADSERLRRLVGVLLGGVESREPFVLAELDGGRRAEVVVEGDLLEVGDNGQGPRRLLDGRRLRWRNWRTS